MTDDPQANTGEAIRDAEVDYKITAIVFGAVEQLDRERATADRQFRVELEAVMLRRILEEVYGLKPLASRVEPAPAEAAMPVPAPDTCQKCGGRWIAVMLGDPENFYQCEKCGADRPLNRTADAPAAPAVICQCGHGWQQHRCGWKCGVAGCSCVEYDERAQAPAAPAPAATGRAIPKVVIELPDSQKHLSLQRWWTEWRGDELSLSVSVEGIDRLCTDARREALRQAIVIADSRGAVYKSRGDDGAFEACGQIADAIRAAAGKAE